MKNKDFEFDEDIRKKYDLRTKIGKQYATKEQLSRNEKREKIERERIEKREKIERERIYDQYKKRKDEEAKHKEAVEEYTRKVKFIAWAKANNHNPSYPPVGEVLLEFKRRPWKYFLLFILLYVPVLFPTFSVVLGLGFFAQKLFSFDLKNLVGELGFASLGFAAYFTSYLIPKLYEKLNLKEFFILKILFPIILIGFLCLWDLGYLNEFGLPKPIGILSNNP